MSSLAAVAQAFLEHLEGGGDSSPEDFLAARDSQDPETVEVLSVLAGMHGRPSRPDRFGSYALVRELGRGAQGVVYLARDTRLDRQVALKILTADAAFGTEVQGLLRDLKVAGASASLRLLDTVGALRRFRREVRAATRLDHPGICGVYEAGTVDGSSYIAMRYVEGRSLSEAIRSEASPAAGTRVPEVCRLVEKAAEALHAAHEAGLVHRDVKPGNIMVSDDGDPVILDFGLARQVDAGDLTQTGAAVGTPVYMSPEQIAASGPVDRRTDVYALGVVLFECLTLERPFTAPTLEGLYRQILEGGAPKIRRINAAVSPELEVVVDTALQREPGRRYRTAQDLADDLRRVQEKRPIRARPPGVLLRLRRWMQRSPALAASLGSIFVLLAVGFAVVTGLWQETRTALGQVEEERDAKDVALRRSRALALANASAAEIDANPARAVLLARAGARFELVPAVVSALHDALNRPLETRIISGHKTIVRTVSYSPDGKLLVTASHDKTARIWDPDGTELAVLAGHEDTVSHARFSPDGQRILTCCWDRTARLWTSKGELLKVLRGHEHRLAWGAFSPDGQEIATASWDGTVRLWSADGSPRDTKLRHDKAATSVEFSPDGTRILTGSWDRTARIWDRSGKELTRFEHPWAVDATFSPDGQQVFTVGHAVRILKLDGSLVREIPTGGTEVAIAPKGDRFLAAAGNRHTAIWGTDGRKRADLRGHGGDILGASFSPDGQRVATASVDGTVRIWDADGGEAVIFRGLGAYSAAFSPDGERIVVAGMDTTARIWRLDGTEDLVLRGHKRNVAHAVFSPDGRHVLTAGGDGTARIWSLDGEVLETFKGHERPLFHAEFSADGAMIATCAGDGTARIWDRDGTLLHVLTHPDRWVMRARFSPDGQWVATTSRDRGIRIWGVNGVLQRTVPHGEFPWGVAFSPRSDLFAAASRDAPRVRVWNLDGTRSAECRGHEGPVYWVDFSPSGDRIVTAGTDGTARIWSVDGAELAVLRGHAYMVRTARFSPDGRFVVTASVDGTVRLWHTDPHELLRVADQKIIRDFTPEERLRFAELLGGSKASD